MVAACGASESADPPGDRSIAEPPPSSGEASVDDEFDWQGHRGARGLRPENTLPGFEFALDLGVDTLELDLHLSADEQVVVWHDPVVDATKCSGDGIGSPVRRLTAAELRNVRCASNPDSAAFPDQVAEAGAISGDDFGIITLGELFRFVEEYSRSADKTAEQREAAATVRFNIETKRRPDDPSTIDDGFDGTVMGAFEQAAVAAVDNAGLGDRTTIQSFDHRSLWAIRSERPDIDLVALSRRNDRVDFADLVARGASVWSPDHRDLDAGRIVEAHDAGLAVVPWTVNDPDDMDRLIEAGVDGIITDRPDLRATIGG